MGLLPVFERLQHVAVIVNGFQNLRERHVVALGKEIAQHISLTGIERRGGNVEYRILVIWEVSAKMYPVVDHTASFSSAKNGHAELARVLSKLGVALVVSESTGKYHCSIESGFSVAVVNP